MKLHFNNLIDKYNYDEFTDDEKELFYLSLELNQQLRMEFMFYLSMKYFLLEGGIEKVHRFLAKYNV